MKMTHQTNDLRSLERDDSTGPFDIVGEVCIAGVETGCPHAMPESLIFLERCARCGLTHARTTFAPSTILVNQAEDKKCIKLALIS